MKPTFKYNLDDLMNSDPKEVKKLQLETDEALKNISLADIKSDQSEDFAEEALHQEKELSNAICPKTLE